MAQHGGGVTVVTGRVLTTTGVPLAGATVSLSPIGRADSVIARATSDNGGRYALASRVPVALLTIRRLGYISSALAVDIRIAIRDTINRDIRMSVVPATLEAVVTRARRSPVQPTRESPGSSRRSNPSSVTDLFPVTAGDLSQIGALTPGVVQTAAGDESGALSIAGQPPGANHISVDGSTFAGASLPAEAVSSATVVLGEYDVARGQFTGGEVVAKTRSGGAVWGGALRAALTPARLKYGADGRVGQNAQSGVRQLDGGGGGPLVPDQFFGYGAFTVSRRDGAAPYLDSNDAQGLLRLGISADSARRFLGVARVLGVVPAAEADTRSRLTSAVGLGRLDWALGERHLLTLRADGRAQSSRGTGSTPYGIAGTGGQQSSRHGGAMLVASSQFTHVRHDARLYVAQSRRSWEADRVGPAGVVRVNSMLPAAGDESVLLRFGGNAFGFDESGDRVLEVRDDVEVARAGAHRWKLGGLLTRHSSVTRGGPNSDGTFSFASIADFDASTPYAYSLSQTGLQQATIDSWALYLGDVWRRSERLVVTAGLRAEGARYPIVRTLAASADSLLEAVHQNPTAESMLLPRFGFVFEGGTMTVRGGAGIFRGSLSTPALIAAVSTNGSAATLSCVGSATPRPDWAGYARGTSVAPSACATGAPAFASRSPDIALFAPGFGAGRLVRASLGGDLRISELITIGLQASHARGWHEPSARELNLRATPEFTLFAERDRPVFAPRDAIDSVSGTIARDASRANPALGSLRQHDGEGRSETAQLGLGVDGVLPGQHGVLSFWYTFTRSRERTTGVPALMGAGTTAGDPNVAEWGSRDFEQPHVLQLTLLGRATPKLKYTITGRLTSGVPFAPRVDGDINGDQLFNDRAFVFDPDSIRDQRLAAGLTRLLENSSAPVADCLRAQRGRIAVRDSCRTRWSPWMDAQVNVGPFNRGGHDLTLLITAQNVTAGLDHLLHGRERVRGWGQFPFVDDVLLRVRGFDPASGHFRYDVNQAFGTYGTARSGRAPMALRIQGRVTLGADPARQLIANAAAASRGARRTPEQLMAWATARFPNIPALVLAQAQSLALTPAQRQQLQLHADSINAPLRGVHGALTRALSGAPVESGRPTRDIVDSGLSLIERGREMARAVLSARQWERLPRMLRDPNRNEPTAPPAVMEILTP